MRTRTFPGMFALRFPFRAPEDDQGGVAVETPETETPAPEGESDDEGQEPENPEGEGEASEGDGGEEPAEGAAEGEGDADPDEPPAPKRRDWRDRQLEKRNRELAEARDKAAAAEKRAKDLEELYAKPEGERDEGQIARVREEAKEVAKAELRTEAYYAKLNTSLADMDSAGSKAFPKTWNERIEQARELFGEDLGKRADILETITDTANPAAVYHALAGDLDKLEAIIQMPPHKAAIAIERLSAELGKAPPRAVSQVPAPIRPLEKRGATGDLPLDHPDVTQEEFNRRRAAAEAKKYG